MEACGTEGAEHVAEKTKTRKTREQKRKEKIPHFQRLGVEQLQRQPLHQRGRRRPVRLILQQEQAEVELHP